MSKNISIRKIALLTLILIVAACNKSPEKNQKGPEKKEPMVKVVVVEKTNLASFIELTGTVRPNITSDVSAPIEGVLEKLLVRENSIVKKDELVGVISSSDRNALIASNQQKIKELETKLAKTDKSSSQYAEIQQQLLKAQKDYEYALSMYQTYPVVAPMSGMVTKRYFDQGSQLTARQAFIAITDMSSLVIKVELNEKYFSKIKQGDKVDLTLNAYPGKTFTGIVSLINPEINPVSRTVMIDLKLVKNSEKILPGMMAEIKLPIEKKKDVLAVPNDAILTKPSEEKFVFIVLNGHAYEHIVKLGLVTQKQTEVTEGLQLGDSVVIMGQQMLKDSMKVKVMQPKPEKNIKK